MLSAVLPGLREVRSAVAAGYLWLLVGWLALRETLPTREGASGVWDAFYELGDITGAIGLGAAATFAAYLLGSLAVPLLDQVLTPAYRVTRNAWFDVRHTRGVRRPLSRLTAEEPVMRAGELSGAGSHSLANHVRYSVNEAVTLGYPGSQIDDPALQNQMFSQVITELRLVERRLIGDQVELHSEIDRLRSEAELRTAIAPPMTALVIFLTLSSSLWWGPALLVPAALYVQGQLRMRERNDSLVDALLLGRVEAPALERLRLASEDQANARRRHASE